MQFKANHASCLFNCDYENERILTYALWYEANKGLVPIPHRMHLADKLYLVLVFDERGILKRRKLKSGGK